MRKQVLIIFQFIVLVTTGFAQITKHGGDSNADLTTNIVEAGESGSTIRVGYTISDDSTSLRSYIAKFDVNENPVWQKNYRGFPVLRDWNQFHDLIKTFDGNYLVTGEIGSLTERHLFVAKFDENGNLIWSTEYGKPTSSAGVEVVERSVNGVRSYLVTGYEETADRGKEILTLIFNQSGELLSGRMIGSTFDDVGTGIDWNKNFNLSDFSICGSTNLSGTQDVFYLNLEDSTHTNPVIFDGGADDEAVDFTVRQSFENSDVLIGVNTTSFGPGDYNMALIVTKSELDFGSTNSYAFLSREEEKMFNFRLGYISGYYRDTVSGLRHGIQLIQTNVN